MSSIFVIVYDPPQADVAATQRLYYQHRAVDEPVPTPERQPPHFIGKFSQPQHTLLPLLRQRTADDFSSSALETNVHFIPRFTQPQHLINRSVLQQQDRAATTFIATIEAPPHFIGNFVPYTFSIIPPFGGASDGSSSALETNQDFKPRFTDWKYNSPQYLYRFQDLSTSGFGPGPGNQHFIGRFTQPQHSFLRPFSRADSVGSSALETNVHFVPHFYPVQFTLLPGLRSGLSLDISTSGLSTPIDFKPKHTPAQHFVLRLLREQADWASTNIIIQATTPPHFIGKFTAPIFYAFRYNSSAPDMSSSALETNVHFLAKFSAPLFTPVPGLYWETAQDLSTTPPIPPQPPPTFPAIYYILEDMYINGVFLQAGTTQSTSDIGGVLPVNWTPNANVDPVNGNAVNAYRAAGYQPRGLIRTQWSILPVAAPKFNWKVVNGIWTLVAGKGSPSEPDIS